MSAWPTRALSEIGTVITGSTPRTSEESFFGGDIPFVTPSDLDLPDIITQTQRTLTEAGAQVVRLVPKDAILVCCIGSLGKVGIAGRDLATNQQINAVIFESSRVWPRFGFYACQRLKSKLEAMAPATTVAIVTKSKFETLEIPLPPLPEQKRIAAILDQADELRRKRRRSIEVLNALPQAVFVKMFGDPRNNPKCWPSSALGSVGSLDRGVSKHRPRNDPILLGGPYPLVQTGDIANCDGYVRASSGSYSEEGLKQSKLWPKGTLCITIAANIGKTGILTFDACFPDSIVSFTPGRSVRSEYVQHWMSFIQRKLEDDAPQFAQKNINLAILRALSIPLPPVTLQDEFVRQVGSVYQTVSANNAHLSKLDVLFSSLQHRAFSGQLTAKDAERKLKMAS